MTRRTRRRTPQRDGFWLTLIKRPTGEILVLFLAMTVCGSIIVGGTAIIALAFVEPSFDTSFAGTKITGLLNTMVGLMAGFLAGRTDSAWKRNQDDEEEK